MHIARTLDCLVIGYNDPPFERYEEMLRAYGRDSEAYRDLQYSFVNLDGRKLSYADLLTEVSRTDETRPQAAPFRSGDIPNLAAVYLTSFLRRRGFAADYINLFQAEKDLLGEYLSLNPVCVAITTTFYVINFPVNEIVTFIRQHNPSIPIVVGGPLIANHSRNYSTNSMLPTDRTFASALRDIGADYYIVESQGELTLARLVETLKCGRDPGNVPNIVFFEGDALRITPKEPEDNSLDENYIDWRMFPERDLGPTLQTRTARSCAFRCSFCNYPARAGALKLTSLEVIEKELDLMRELGGVRNVVFIDDTFNVPLPRFKDICRLMIRKNYGFEWFSYFRCANSDDEAIELMALSGCRGVFLGIESGSQQILKNMNKAATVEKYSEGIERLRKHNIITFASFIVGFPGETAETVEETSSFIRNSRPDYYRAQLWYCEKDTPVERRRDQFGISGDGFVWSHATMDSSEAMDHIDQLFLSTQESQWLPQWSFDFWIIPYLLGRGLSAQDFKTFMSQANRLLAMEIASGHETEKAAVQRRRLQQMAASARDWRIHQ